MPWFYSHLDHREARSHLEPPESLPDLHTLRGWSHAIEAQDGMYPVEMQERVDWMVFKFELQLGWQREMIRSDCEKLGPRAERVRKRVHRAQIGSDVPPRSTPHERSRLRDLERENRELHRTNEIPRSASVFFEAELDGLRTRSRPSIRIGTASGSRRSMRCGSVPRTPTGRRGLDPGRSGRPRTRRSGSRSLGLIVGTSVCTARTRSGLN